MRVLIIGGSGNLGTHFARALLDRGHEVSLSFHRTPIPPSLAGRAGVDVRALDLDAEPTDEAAFRGVDAVVYCAGKLFAPHPERFLPRTNVGWATRAIDASMGAGVRKFVLLSFPHVEEDTTPDRPAVGTLETEPRAIHARTRLEAERILFERARGTPMTPIVLRLGMVYGPNVKLLRAARTLLRWRILAVWRAPTWVHLIHVRDCERAVEAALEKPVAGIFNVCDDRPVTLQSFLDELARKLGCAKPLRLPAWCFVITARLVEIAATILGTPAPLTRDMLSMGMTSVVADTSRMKRELLDALAFPTFDEGLRAWIEDQRPSEHVERVGEVQDRRSGRES
jgi:nucleoside-diphosphate-sugar epimerase